MPGAFGATGEGARSVEQTPQRSAERRAPCVIGRGTPRQVSYACRVMARIKVRRSAPAVLGASLPRLDEAEDGSGYGETHRRRGDGFRDRRRSLNPSYEEDATPAARRAGRVV